MASKEYPTRFAPRYEITPALSRALIEIEANRQAISLLPITLQVITSLRESARLTSTHYSTQIEGNRLTQEQVEKVVKGGVFPNRKRDQQEVKNYYLALNYVDELISESTPEILESHTQAIHGLVMAGREKPTPYRDGQNVIRDSGSNAIVYMPPEAKDVPGLMQEMIAWINGVREERELPVPIIAAIAHYQFATIHPYYDGNGRSARLLTSLILHKYDYGLKGVYSLEEYYARNLHAYYDALAVGESHNYYFGRVEADITNWIIYFCRGMAEAFANVRMKSDELSKHQKAITDHAHLLRELDQRQKQILSLFKESRFITTREISELLQIHRRTALDLCKQWIEQGFIIQHGASRKSRKYELAEQWLELVL